MNFCVEGIGTTISVNQVEADGYEVQNLLRNSSTNQNSGFRVEHFVRPPVVINIQFPLCIEISHIVICPKVDKQTSSAFMIHTETSYRTWTKDQNGPLTTHLVAKEFINTTPMPNIIVFRNPRFVVRRPFSNLPSDQYNRYRNHDSTFNLRHPSVNACERVVGLQLTILRVSESSIPALGSVQVWGQPCIRCPQDKVDKILKTWMRLSRRVESPTPASKGKTSSSSSDESPKRKKARMSPVKSSTVTEAEFTVPEEFLDAITYEVMCQPIRLPCGLAVDSLTLEKYYAEEAMFGRLPNDPFTGVPFTDRLKPVSDAALKCRLDAFLIQNSDKAALHNIPRTVGKTTPGRVHIPSTATTIKRLSHISNNVPPPICTKPSEIVTSDVNTKKPSMYSLSAAESLQLELSRLLGPHSSYLFPESAVKKDTTKICAKCDKSFEAGNVSSFYVSPCTHMLFCRECLLQFSKHDHNPCSTCTKKWKARECNRVFI